MLTKNDISGNRVVGGSIADPSRGLVVRRLTSEQFTDGLAIAGSVVWLPSSQTGVDIRAARNRVCHETVQTRAEHQIRATSQADDPVGHTETVIV